MFKQKLLVITALFLSVGNLSAAMATIEESHGLPTVADLERMSLEQTIAEAAPRIEAAIEGRELSADERAHFIRQWTNKINIMLPKMKHYHKLPEREQWSHALHMYGVQRLRQQVEACEICMEEEITEENLCERTPDGTKELQDTKGRFIYRFELMRCGRKNAKFPHLADRPHIMCKTCVKKWRGSCAFCRQKHKNEDVKF